MYLLLRGNFDIAERLSTGEPGKLREIGETPDFSIMVAEERAEGFATGGRFNTKDMSETISLDITGSLKVEEAEKNNLALAVFGTVVEEAGGPVVAQAFSSSAIVAGEKHFLPGRPLNVSALTIVDSAGTPDTLEAGTDYEADLKNGTVTFKNVTGFTQPFKASFTEGASSAVSIGTAVPEEKFLFFRGVNIANSDKPCVAEMYRTKFSPAKEIALKTADGKTRTGFEFSLEFLADPTKPDDPVLGRYGRIRYV